MLTNHKRSGLNCCGTGLLAALCWLAAPAAAAEDKPLTYDRVNLSASARAEVDNDTLVAVLYTQAEGRNSAMLADEVNRTIGWAVGIAKQAPDVTVSTLSYQTNPIYDKRTLTGWRVRQSIRLESSDSAKLSKLIATLQERLAVQSIGYTVSPQRHAQAEDRLIREAIAAFTSRANLISGELGTPDYRLVRMDVNTGRAPVRPMAMRTMAMAEKVAAPTLEAGASTVQVNISGTIELMMK